MGLRENGASWLDLAEERVSNNPQLDRYKFDLITYPWEDYSEHIKWVATAPEQEILNWCKDLNCEDLD